jgi:hypothetical protein
MAGLVHGRLQDYRITLSTRTYHWLMAAEHNRQRAQPEEGQELGQEEDLDQDGLELLEVERVLAEEEQDQGLPEKLLRP